MKYLSNLTSKFVLSVLTAAIISLTSLHASETPGNWVVCGQDRVGVSVIKDDLPRFTFQFKIFEQWGTWGVLKEMAKATNGVRVFDERDITFQPPHQKPKPSKLNFHCTVEQQADGNIRFLYGMSNAAPTDYHMPWDSRFGMEAKEGRELYGIGPWLPANTYFADGECRIEFSDNTTETIPLPPPAKWGKTEIRRVTLSTAAGEKVDLAFDPAIAMHCDHGEMRLFVRQSAAAGEAVEQEMLMTLPRKPAFEPGNRLVDTSNWIVFENNNDHGPGSVIGLEDWFEKPAGRRGFVGMDGSKFTFADGTPVKFFGVNISWDHMACAEEKADQWNDRWAKYGVNLVRLHKFIDSSWAGIMTESDHSVPDPKKVLRFDYYHASARKRGIYTAWSPVFGMKVRPADKERVKHYDEIMAASNQGKTLLLLTVAPDIQDLLIDRVIKLLNRKNSVTGIRYADDPALAYVEMQNEDDIFFDTNNFESVRQRWPNYYQDFQVRFNDFLREKYGSQEILEKTWGADYPKNQKLADNSIRTWYPWWENKVKLVPRQRDTLLFLYQEQSVFYHRFLKAIRETGYKGAIVGSCWQGWGWHGHLFNMLTDYEVGFIDRHNYAPTFLDRPGVGLFSVGYQQVKDRPFNLSEWGGDPIAVPTVNFYGMGLQGWAAQCQFSSNSPTIYNRMARGCNTCCDDFIQVGQWPALARSVHRGDVKEGEVVFERRVSIPGLKNGDVGFSEEFSLLGGGANLKEFSAGVPKEAIMAGRVTLDFIDGPVPDEPLLKKFAPYLDPENKRVTSTTGQLIWNYGGRGFYTVDTEGTQAVIGYVKGQKISLAHAAFVCEQDTPLTLYLTALDKNESIGNARRLLITALGRDANTGMIFDEYSDKPIVAGGEPLLIEPIQATITLKDRKVKSVLPLDHGGRLRDGAVSLPVKNEGNNAVITIDGKASRTMYYLVEMQ